MTTTIVLYTKKDCPLCDEAKESIETLSYDYDFVIRERDIYEEDELIERYGLMIPVVEIDGKEVDYGKIDLFSLSNRLQRKKG
ncbi:MULTISPECIES: glutaredoxin family protein [Pontibacillus]|uniref:Glutaredoxin family protein n=1 Tax=Pontibacillus chungwhensis TaxID=265426 RepID=A0ABY8V0Z5_9BACI|nr:MULTISPECIES: glutaredoxin family protein [Pontibacillus]MCD5325298.1 glutaredoxin family protein [Pontibacillus sp. HN14]WIF97541.1 glutaredoxin family protein [Pontibacillus chungwhensis]